MTYSKYIKKIESFIPNKEAKWNKNFGLEKFLFLMNKLGNPHNGLKYVHVGGTAGKGSTSTFISSILTQSGYKTGLHVSPHTITTRERAQINGISISEKDFTDIFGRIEPLIDSMELEYGFPPSYFEILLAIAFVYFKEQKCDVVVLEVGLGGKLDGTNIIDSKYQVITNIGLDHTKILGSTKEEILMDKREIIKPNSIVVTGIQEPKLKKIIEEKVKTTNSKIYYLNQDFSAQQILIENETHFDFVSPRAKIQNIQVHPGTFQIINATVAIEICLQMQKNFSKINEETIKKGIATAYIPGRFEILSKEPVIIIDGAHNPDKFKALVESINAYFPNEKFICVFRFKKRDDILQSMEILQKISSHIIMTGSKRAGDMGLDEMYDNEDIKMTNEKFSNISFEPELSKAYKKAKEMGGNILITGSIYMISEFMKIYDNNSGNI